MIKSSIHILTTFLYSSFFSHQASSKRPARLGKHQSKTSFEKFCDRVAPYVLLFALVTLMILLLVILVKYGHSITGTEANNYEHLTQITTGR